MSRHPCAITNIAQYALLRSSTDVIATATTKPNPPQWITKRHFLFKHSKIPDIDHDHPLSPAKETSESKLFKMGSTLASRMSTDRKIQCTEVDSKGDIRVDHKEIKRSELVSKFGIQARDLRKIDESQLPSILVRDSTILANLLRFRVLITHDRILILHVFRQKETESNHNSALMYGLRGGLQLGSSNLPYEFRSLETLLLMVISELDIEFEELCAPVNEVLEALDKDVSLEKLKRLLDVSKQLSAFQQKVKLVRQALHTVLEADNDMAAMYLTDKAAGKPRAEADHEEIEMLLENYFEASGEIVEKAENLLSDVEYTHDSVKSILDSHRNLIMMLEVRFSVAMLSIASGTYIAGLYGMNVINGLEEAVTGFPIVTGGSIIGIFGVGLFGIHMLRRIQRIYKWQGRRHR